MPWQNGRIKASSEGLSHVKRDFLIGMKRVQFQRVADANGPTHVMLSFGSADGGALFAQWVRREIMSRKRWTQPNNVYLDTIALAEAPGTNFVMGTSRRSGHTGGLASINGGWNDYYKYAVAMARCMVFVFTGAWLKSPWCRLEWNQFQEENQARAREGRPRLRGIGLTFPEDGAISRPGAGVEPIAVRRKYAVANARVRAGLAGSYGEFWTLEETDLSRLLMAIG